jgi:isopenicillin N synthase-like dioxygenase
MGLVLPTTQLPNLDLRHLEQGGAQRANFLAELRETVHTLGFFYLSGHGIESGLIADVLALSRRFFALPEAEKLSIAMVNSPHFRGYNRAGLEHTRGRPDWREQIDIGAELKPWPRDPALPPWTRLQGPNQWPAALPELKPILLRYQAEVTALGIRITRALALSLSQAENVFEPIYTPAPNQLLKIIRYPGRDAEAGSQGVGEHKDSGFVTVLLQDTAAGLQVEGPNGWIDAKPVPGTFVINVGELLEMASNGYLRANVHRVVSPPVDEDRISVAFFLGARLDSMVPLLHLPPELAAEARGVTQDPLNPLFRDVAKNYLKSRLRSHPDVARRHHADLLDPKDRAGPLAQASAY